MLKEQLPETDIALKKASKATDDGQVLQARRTVNSEIDHLIGENSRDFDVKKVVQSIEKFRKPDGLIPEVQFTLDGEKVDTLGVFSTALVAVLLEVLLRSPETTASMRKELAESLLKVRDSEGTWSFNGPGKEYPPDIDDTALALVATRQILGHESREMLSRLLQVQSRNANGLLETWITPDRPSPVDIVVNMHVLLACRMLGVKDLNLEKAVKEEIENGRAKTGYYCSGRYVRSISALAGFDGNLIQLAPGISDFEGHEVLFRKRRSEVFYSTPAVFSLLDLKNEQY